MPPSYLSSEAEILLSSRSVRQVSYNCKSFLMDYYGNETPYIKGQLFKV